MSFFSLSAKKPKSIAEKTSSDPVAASLLKYTLDPVRENLFSTYLFPRAASTKTAKVTVKHYNEVIMGLAQVSAGVDNIFAALRYMLQYAKSFDTTSKEEANKQLSDKLKTMSERVNDVAIINSVKNFHDSLTTGKTFVIKPSTKYKDGFDIVYSGLTQEQTLRVANSDYNNITRSVPDSFLGHEEYNRTKNELYNTELSLKALSVARSVLETLFKGPDASNVGNGHKRIGQQLNLAFDFKTLNHLLASGLGVTGHYDFIKSNIPSSIINSGLSDYISIYVQRNPLAEIVEQHEKRLTRIERGETIAPIDNSKVLTDESILFPQLSFSIVLHIPKDFAHFITQTPEETSPALNSLFNWARLWSAVILKRQGSRSSGDAKFEGKSIKRANLPRYILKASSIPSIPGLRSKNGHYVEQGRSNDQDLFIANNGTFQYCPKSNDDIAENAAHYEQDMDKLLQTYFDLDIPVDLSRENPPLKIFNVLHDKQVAPLLKEQKTQLARHTGKLLAYTWDYDTILSVGAGDPSSISTSSLVGAVKPAVTAIADYLGMSYPDENGKYFGESMAKLLASSSLNGPEAYSAKHFDSYPDAITGTPAFTNLLNFYSYLAACNQVPDFQTLIDTAAKELDLTTLKDTLEDGLYFNDITNELKSKASPSAPLDNTGLYIREVLRSALQEASAGRGTALYTSLLSELGSNEAVQQELPDHPKYFNVKTSRLSEFGNLYNYLGGKIFHTALNAILALPKSKILSDESYADQYKEKILKFPSFNTISKEIMPLVIMFANYVPNSKQIIEDAEKELVTFSQDSSITASDIEVPGLLAGTQAFPHQIKTQSVLRQRPKFGILDISPGGGKTSIGVMDAAACVKEMKELGVRIKPLIIAPDGLIKTWCDDTNKFFGANWNVIPLNSAVYNRWGQERLEELLTKAPDNTIVVTGLNFLKSKMFSIVLGSNTVRISGALEFVKRFGFNYILMDESHKAKNTRSLVHITVKQLTTASHVKFIRLATGTLISNTLTDVVGQTALISSHVFRTPEEYEAEYANPDGPGFRKDTPRLARRKLSRHAAVITMKRKEWAFMLPNPIESFIGVSLVGADTKYSELHQEVYNAVLDETLAVLSDKVKEVKSFDEDDSDEEEEETSRGGGGDSDEEGEDLELEKGKDQLAGLEGLLRPYLQRLERIITDPMGDPLGQEIFKRAGVNKFVSRKVQKIVDVIRGHFDVEPWTKSKNYRELDLVEYNDKLYLLRKMNHGSLERQIIPSNQRPPDQDTDSWKEEPKGKVLVFCRYTRSVSAIFDALPPDLQKRARKFTGDEGKEKWSNLEDFKKNPNVEILVANEQAMTEGHNLQIASRIVRVENPWAPGDLEQASARIFRPDPTAARNMAKTGKPGELYRELIYLDWVLGQGTMEVAKFGRLVQKIVNKTKFDEADNQRYNRIQDIELEPISMSLDFLRSRLDIGDIPDYIDSYTTIKGIEREEFSEMRRSKEVKMHDLPEAPNVAGASRIDIVPLLADQSIPDPDKFGLVSGRDFINQESNIEYRRNPQLLIGLPVKVEFGTGTIVGVKQKWTTDETGERVIDETDPVSSVTVRIGDDEQELKYSIKEVWFATDLDSKKKKLFDLPKNWASNEQKSKISKNTKAQAEDEELDAEEQAAKERKAKIKALRDAEKQELARERGAKRQENKERGKPINADIYEVVPKDKPASKKGKAALDVSDKDDNMSVDLNATVYNGFLTVAVDAVDPDHKKLSKLGFRQIGPYAYINVKNGKQFNAFLDYIESKFTLSKATESRMEEIQAFFDESSGYKFNSTLSNPSELNNFFRTSHRMVTDRKEVKVYPVVLDDHLMLTVDIETNPGIKRHLGKKIDGIPGSNGTWTQSEGASLYFAKNKAEAKEVVKKLKDAGFTVENDKEFLSDINELQFRKKRGE